MSNSKKELLSFEAWFDQKMVENPNGPDIACSGMYVACMAHLRAHRCAMISIAHKNNGMLESNDEKFKSVQKEWCANFQQIMILRQCLLFYFHFNPPPWKELMPEREYFGTLLSEEDYLKFLTDRGFKLLKPETIDEKRDREDRELEEEREEAKKEFELERQKRKEEEQKTKVTFKE